MVQKHKTDAQQCAQDDPATYDLPVKIAQDARSQREQGQGGQGETPTDETRWADLSDRSLDNSEADAPCDCDTQHGYGGQPFGTLDRCHVCPAVGWTGRCRPFSRRDLI